MSYTVLESTARDEGRCKPWTCCGDNEPLANYSAAHEEGPSYFKMVPRKEDDDEEDWKREGCLRWCYSSISQEDADQCAEEQAKLCNRPDIPWEDNDNDEVTYSITCPTGGTYQTTVPTGEFTEKTKDEANAKALSLCQYLASTQNICLSGDLANACYGEAYADALTILGTATPASMSITSGALPVGLFATLVGNEVQIVGTPFERGDFTFTVSVTSTGGGVATRTVTLCVLRIITATSEDAILANGQVGTFYIDRFLPGGCAGNYKFTLTAGSIPTGMTMNDEGFLYGTPTIGGVYNFTVEVEEE